MGGQEGSRGRCGASARLPDAPTGAHCRFARATGGGFPNALRSGLSGPGADGVPRGSRCPASPRHALLAENPTWKRGGSRLYESIIRTFGMTQSDRNEALEPRAVTPEDAFDVTEAIGTSP